MNAIQIFVATVQLLPVVIQAIKTIEQAVPESGKGAMKLELVRVMLEKAYGTSNDFMVLWPTVSSAITVLVKLFTK